MPRQPQPFLTQLFDLTLIQLSNWRWSWRNTIVIGMIVPLISMVALSSFAGKQDEEALTYVFIGNLVLALLFSHQGRVASNFAYMRQSGMLDYFATLPIYNVSLILGTLTAFFVLFLPSLLVTMLAGHWLLGLELHLHPLCLLILPLVSAPLAGLGAYIGTLTRRPEDSMSINQVITLVFLGMGPVMIPPDRLPGWLLTLGWFSPANYAASALRQVILGPVTARLWLDVVAMLLFTVVSLWLVSKRMDWRQK
jgi:ABC-2 type transport system permease protein